MRTKLAILCAAFCLARAACAVTMASQPWTTNRIAEAEARVDAKIAADTLAAVSNVVASGGLATVDAVDAKISTNNAAFVSAVLAVPIAGADASDSAELAEYGSYGTVGAALLALIAGLAALKRRMGTAETSLAQKADAADLPYRLVTPGKWEFSELPTGYSDPVCEWDSSEGAMLLTMQYDGSDFRIWNYDVTQDSLSVSFQWDEGPGTETHVVTATRASLPGHLCDRAGNRVVVSGDTTLTLPAAVPGYLRDFLVRLEISGSTVPTITFQPDGNESVTYETDGDEFPVPDEAGSWLYSFTESCVAHKFAVSLKMVNTVAQGGV